MNLGKLGANRPDSALFNSLSAAFQSTPAQNGRAVSPGPTLNLAFASLSCWRPKRR
jgi:hypothetical protein